MIFWDNYLFEMNFFKQLAQKNLDLRLCRMFSLSKSFIRRARTLCTQQIRFSVGITRRQCTHGISWSPALPENVEYSGSHSSELLYRKTFWFTCFTFADVALRFVSSTSVPFSVQHIRHDEQLRSGPLPPPYVLHRSCLQSGGRVVTRWVVEPQVLTSRYVLRAKEVTQGLFERWHFLFRNMAMGPLRNLVRSWSSKWFLLGDHRRFSVHRSWRALAVALTLDLRETLDGSADWLGCE